ncbi:MAG: copper resistance protein CopC, partial [Solirubrobacterales bacterium]|nr:copper resistance protein CopC [Solirubrobacterales bacterium]
MFHRTLVVAAVVLGALCAGPAAAVAHPLLLQTAPNPGLISPQIPAAIRLQLSEPIVARGSRIVLTGPRGVKVPTGPAVASDDGKGLSVRPTRPLRSAVYRVRWTALGDDGHLVRGDFSFGVAGKNGAPPAGAERLGGAGAGGLGGERADQDGFVGTIARWLGIVAASFLFGAATLLVVLRRRSVPAADAAGERVRLLAPLAWLLAALAASESVIARIVTTADGSVDLGLLTSGATGRAELVRALVVVLGSFALLATAGRIAPVRRDLLFGGAGVAVLLTYALSGHALAGVGALALLAQAVHVLAAGLWLGGLIALVAVTRDGGVRVLDGARAFARPAAAALALAIVSGVIAAVREVDRWSLLRWSDYGRVVIIKSVLVAAVAAAGGWAAWRSRR